MKIYVSDKNKISHLNCKVPFFICYLLFFLKGPFIPLKMSHHSAALSAGNASSVNNWLVWCLMLNLCVPLTVECCKIIVTVITIQWSQHWVVRSVCDAVFTCHISCLPLLYRIFISIYVQGKIWNIEIIWLDYSTQHITSILWFSLPIYTLFGCERTDSARFLKILGFTFN